MKLIILNHKMNLCYQDLSEYINHINKIEGNLIIAPSNIYLLEFVKNCRHQISSQDICYLKEGNHTGKVSWSQIKSLGIKYSIIGHSEKQDKLTSITAKVKACLENDITPILCFGNTKKEEEITDILSVINCYDKRIIYAYEPLYNIAKNDIDYQDLTKNIDKIYNHLISKGINDPTVVYGGGLTEKNINKIYHIPKLKGIMIGSKSSDILKLEPLLLNIKEK